MRELTDNELALIAGGYGYDDEDIVVTGSPYPPYYPPYFYPPVWPGDNPQPTPSPGPYYPPSNPQDNYPPDWDHQRDWNIDKVAQDLGKMISDMPDSAHIEYTALIYQMPDGTVHFSKILQGNEYNTGSHTYADYQVPPEGRLIGDMHNHPTYYPGNPEVNWRANSADNGDIRAMQSYHQQSGEAQYRSYLLFNGLVSEYDWVQNQAPRTGPDTDPDPNAVRGGFYPDLGQ